MGIGWFMMPISWLIFLELKLEVQWYAWCVVAWICFWVSQMPFLGLLYLITDLTFSEFIAAYSCWWWFVCWALLLIATILFPWSFSGMANLCHLWCSRWAFGWNGGVMGPNSCSQEKRSCKSWLDDERCRGFLFPLFSWSGRTYPDSCSIQLFFPQRYFF
jgi:hypothetical protein